MNKFLYYGNFFEYKSHLEGYHGQDYMSTGQFIFLAIATIGIILACVFLRKASHNKIDIFLKIMAIIIPLLEITKIIIESYFDIKENVSFNFSGLLPLYTCSLFIYTLPIAAFGKGKAKECCLSFLTTLGIFAGLTNFFMASILLTYPFFNFHTFVSLNFHFWMVFTGIYLISSKYYVPNWKDIKVGFIPVVLLSILVIPFDYIFEFDYMFYRTGWGTPGFISNLARFFGDKGLRFIYTIIVFIAYDVIIAIIVSIIRLICYLKNKLQKIKTEF